MVPLEIPVVERPHVVALIGDVAVQRSHCVQVRRTHPYFSFRHIRAPGQTSTSVRSSHPSTSAEKLSAASWSATGTDTLSALVVMVIPHQTPQQPETHRLNSGWSRKT